MDWRPLAAGEPDAQDRFVRSTVDRVYSLLRGILGHPQEAEDMVQEVYIKAFRALPAFRGASAVETWLYRIAINTARDAIARRQAERKREGGEIDPEAAAATEHPDEAVIRREEERWLSEALDELPGEWRELVVLVDIEGMNVEDAAEVSGVAVGTVKSRLHRARERIRESVRRKAGEGS